MDAPKFATFLAFLHVLPRYPNGELQYLPNPDHFAAMGLEDADAITTARDACVADGTLRVIPAVEGETQAPYGHRSGVERWVLVDTQSVTPVPGPALVDTGRPSMVVVPEAETPEPTPEPTPAPEHHDEQPAT